MGGILASDTILIDSGVKTTDLELYNDSPVLTDGRSRQFLPGYYLNETNGSDNFDGRSPNTPWQTFGRVNGETFGPSESVLFKRGETWREQLLVPSSGIVGRRITFGAYGAGALPILNEADVTAGWVLDAGNVYTVAHAVSSRTVVIEDGTRLDLSVDRISMVQGSFFLDDGANVLYAWCTDDADPDTHTMEVGVRTMAINGNAQDNIIVENLHGKYTTENGIYLNNAENWKVSNCAFTSIRGIGIFSVGTCNSLTIQGSDFDDCGREAIYLSDGVHLSGDVLITYNNFFGEIGWDAWYGDAIDVKANNTATINISNNTVTYAAAWIPPLDQAIGITIDSPAMVERNTITNAVAHALAANAGASGAIFRWNKILYNRAGSTSKMDGIQISDDDVEVYENLFIADAIGTTGSYRAFYLRLNRDGLEIYNNTIWGNWEAGLRHFNGDLTNCEFKNNTVSGFEDYAIQLDAAVTSLDSNYNHLYSAVAANYGRIAAANFATFVDWQGTGYDANSVTAAPQFVGAPADLHLGAGSPCRNAGTDVSLTQDYDGVSIPQETNPAIGAYEYVA